jgi:4-hydroxy-4-methyl-2-oxoglutarate aldolase
MIEEPPLLRIAGFEGRRRPSEAQIEALRGVPTGFICDALEGKAAIGGLKPLDPAALPVSLCGPALTVQSGPEDILALLAALPEIRAGDVLVNAFGWEGCAAAGDRLMGMAKNAGAVGLVTDGPVRDHSGIVDVGLPVFCTGLNPNSPYAKGPGTVGLPVEIGGRRVETGDMIVGDRDGVVVVPFARIDEVITAVGHIGDMEHALDARIRDGLTCPDEIVELLAGSQVRRV